MKIQIQSQRLCQLVSLLNDGLYHDGNSLGEQLKMTRSAIWKAIQKLQKQGILIDSVKGKGYALLEPLILLDQIKIQKNFKNKLSVKIFENIDSTHLYLKQFLSHPKKMICLAEKQTAGIGRLNRHWYSPFAKNIYLSFLSSLKNDVCELAGLSLVVGLAIVQTLSNYPLTKKIEIKWPNDIFYDNKKLAGILIELQAEANHQTNAVIGIGLNVNMLSTDKTYQVSQPFISLREMVGEYLDRNIIVINLVNTLNNYLLMFEKKGLPHFMDEWKQYDYLRGKKVNFKINKEYKKGIVHGINDRGQILIKTALGEMLSLSTGDAQLIHN